MHIVISVLWKIFKFIAVPISFFQLQLVVLHVKNYELLLQHILYKLDILQIPMPSD